MMGYFQRPLWDPRCAPPGSADRSPSRDKSYRERLLQFIQDEESEPVALSARIKSIRQHPAIGTANTQAVARLAASALPPNRDPEMLRL